ncbi:hypothetical protein VT84_13805 [Gemmata sp. SH-PL17]|uniref:hypothetical protein n=1 Tax=Gemmata sp. SH-PL17 TaxID=1630693 RepID=UPI00078E1BD2|nr:hypothetical protein [Gemmata sp. SH-PL17]AMV25468.1 hypothetical protein VT84_13805 [Gemmata sp. SH-PL17]
MSRHWDALTKKPEPAAAPEPDEFSKLDPDDQIYLTWWVTGGRPVVDLPEMYAGADDVISEQRAA